MVNNCFVGFYDDFISDKRLRRRIEKTLFDLISRGTCIINKTVPSHTEKIGAYRMLSNDRFDYMDLLNATYRKCTENVDINHVLAIHDTTEFNYQGIKNKLTKEDKDIGPTGCDTVAGYFCHPMLVVNPANSNIYGLASAIIYNRDWNKQDKHERKYSQQPIEEKESYRWIQSAEQSKLTIPLTTKITVIGDRESDIYEEFYRVPDERTNILVRSRCDRYLENSNLKLYDYLSSHPVMGSYDLPLTSNDKRDQRIATIEIKFCKVSIAAPKKFKGEKKPIILYAIEAREASKNRIDSSKKKDEQILWRLLTTHKVDNYEQAIECINWYKKRWLIEELFRVIKTKGFCIESSQLSSGSRLKKLLVLTLEAAMNVMRLKLSLSQEEPEVNNIFTEQEQDFLEVIQCTVIGATEKQKNPYPKRTLAWAAWTIARMAGWSGYKSHGPPGYITIKDGYDRFNTQLQIYLVVKNST